MQTKKTFVLKQYVVHEIKDNNFRLKSEHRYKIRNTYNGACKLRELPGV
jgi:hypothetical protein